MEIITFPRENEQMKEELTALLARCFPHAYKNCAPQQVALCLEEERIALAAVEEGRLVGFIGAIPQYSAGWELHPLGVDKAHRKQGIAGALVKELEKRCAEKGCLTLYLGTDDEFFQTSLSEGDLFEDTFTKIENIKNLKNHPYEFYQKQGFKIVGVLPDVNGRNKPDIWMAKPLSEC